MTANKTMRFSTTIQAPRRRVWELMLAPDTYREWTAPFAEGSYYEGSWDEGRRVRFLAPGGKDGMIAEVAANRPGEFVSLKHIGQLKDGAEDFDSAEVRSWTPAFENYRFVDKDGGTEVQVELDMPAAYEQYMSQAWPKALAVLKDLCERAPVH